MLRATREFIKSRQPHTDFVVGTMPVQAHDPQLRLWEIQDSVQTMVRTDGRWQAVIGWRVYDYDRLRDETRFQPWWWIVKPDGTAWDVAADPDVREYIMDQGLIVYRREQFQRGAHIRPPDLYLAQGQWQFEVSGERHTLTGLDRENLTSQDRNNSFAVSTLS